MQILCHKIVKLLLNGLHNNYYNTCLKYQLIVKNDSEDEKGNRRIMLYYSTDYDLIAITYDDNGDVIAYECTYHINGIRYVDVWEHGPCDW